MTDNKKQYFCNTPEGRKQYYEANKERISQQLREKKPCVNCGRCVAHGQMTRHMKSKYCKNHQFDTLKRLANETEGINLHAPDVKDKLREQLNKLEQYLHTLNTPN
jgi:ribosomal protein S27AE